MDAKYGRDAILDDVELRLATSVSERSAIFSDDLARYGQQYRFAASNDSEQVKDDSSPVPSPDSDDNLSDVNPTLKFDTRKLTECAEIDDILSAHESLPALNGKPVTIWLHKVYSC